MKLGLVLLMVALGLCGQTAPLGDAEIWTQFSAWVEQLKALPPGERVSFKDRFVKDMAGAGVGEQEAGRRFDRVSVLRRASTEKERVYWNGAFKCGGGPDAPLQLLQETVRSMKPGRALDAGMGRGRNAIFLASLGWDVTGYDMAADALKAAQAAATVAKVKIQTREARHDTFPFGDSQWDLIVCAYCFMQLDDEQWPSVFLKALKPGGVVVFQTSTGSRQTAAAQAARWKGFRLLRFADLDAGVVDNDWTPSKTFPTGMLVARKE
jgi:SAM-dependent methyltransferase